MVALKENLEAIKDSIDKWDKISKGKMEDKGTINCPLCHLYFKHTKKGFSCGKCPIKIKTGKKLCLGTPYERYKIAELSIYDFGEKSITATIFRNWLKDLYIEVSEKELKKLKGGSK